MTANVPKWTDLVTFEVAVENNSEFSDFQFRCNPDSSKLSRSAPSGWILKFEPLLDPPG